MNCEPEEFVDYYWNILNLLRKKQSWITDIKDEEVFKAEKQPYRHRKITIEFLDGIKLK